MLSSSGRPLLCMHSPPHQMYSVHPYRIFTVARSLLDGVDLSSARASFLGDPRAHQDNTDWNQGILDGARGEGGKA